MGIMGLNLISNNMAASSFIALPQLLYIYRLEGNPSYELKSILKGCKVSHFLLYKEIF